MHIQNDLKVNKLNEERLKKEASENARESIGQEVKKIAAKLNVEEERIWHLIDLFLIGG